MNDYTYHTLWFSGIRGRIKKILPSRGSRLATALTCNYLFFQYSLTWHQYTLANDIRVLRSFRKIRLKHAPLRSRQQPPWRHCCFQITSVVVHISFLEVNSNPRVLNQENKEEAEEFYSHALLMTSEVWLGALSCISSTPDVSLWRRLPWLLCVDFYLLHRSVARYSLPMLKVIFFIMP